MSLRSATYVDDDYTPDGDDGRIKPKPVSEMSFKERKALAVDLYAQGFSIADVARTIEVSTKTASKYHDYYDELIRTRVANDPGLLRDVVTNTVRALEENQQARKEAWATLHSSPSYTVKAQLLNTINNMDKTRSALLGLFGVKADYLEQVNAVKAYQDRLLEFMRRELCPEDRDKLELLMDEMSEQYERSRPLNAIPVASVREPA